MSESTTIKVDYLQRGQPGNYQPHTYDARITIEGSSSWNGLTDWQVRELARVVVHNFTDDEPDGSMDSYYRPRLRRLEKIEEERDGLGPCRQVWRVRVEVPYCD